MPYEKILIVEDNPVNMELAVDILEVAGYLVFKAEDAEKGIALARVVRPALILMDVSLPGMDGLVATGLLKRDPITKNIPVVALTAHAMKGDEEKAMAAGCAGYITKPIDTRAFSQTVANFVASLPAMTETKTTEGQGGDAVFDRTTLLNRVSDSGTLLKKIVSLFLADCPKYLTSIREAITRHDNEALRRSAHAFKGSVGNMAAKAAFEAALQLETMGYEGDLTRAEEVYKALEAEIGRLKPALEALAEEYTASE
ncbi:MAG: response regulator [Candidatus Tectomicrobia bacterium]|nr:response regulator [Candidatus Tectomicrobia bacterium]